MSYKPLPFTYGSLTLSQINALTGMSQGETVYNTEWNVIEVYSGNVWTNDQCAIFQSDGTDTIDVGNMVEQNTSGTIRLNTGYADWLGVVARIQSGYYTVAFTGKYDVLVDDNTSASVTNGDALSTNIAPDGLVAVNASPASSTGIVGYCCETKNGSSPSYLVKCAVQTVEIY